MKRKAAEPIDQFKQRELGKYFENGLTSTVNKFTSLPHPVSRAVVGYLSCHRVTFPLPHRLEIDPRSFAHMTAEILRAERPRKRMRLSTRANFALQLAAESFTVNMLAHACVTNRRELVRAAIERKLYLELVTIPNRIATAMGEEKPPARFGRIS